MITEGTKIVIAVGQMGNHVTSGSGGTFVVDENGQPLLIAGGAAGMDFI